MLLELDWLLVSAGKDLPVAVALTLPQVSRKSRLLQDIG